MTIARSVAAFVLLLLVTFSGTSHAGSVAWGSGSATVSGSNDPALAALAAYASTDVRWLGGQVVYTREPPPGSQLYAFHAADAPASIDSGRLGAVVRTFVIDTGPPHTTQEIAYDLDGDGRYLPHERTYRIAVGSTYTDPDYGATNARMVVDAQRPASAWMDDVVFWASKAKAVALPVTDPGFEAGSGTDLSQWVESNSLEPPIPVAATSDAHAGAQSALLPVSNDARTGDMPMVSQTITLADRPITKNEPVLIEFWAKASAADNIQCGARVRAYQDGALKSDSSATQTIAGDWTLYGLPLDVHEKSQILELDLYCQRTASFVPPTQSPMRLFLVGP